jgi:hypothetical protein
VLKQSSSKLTGIAGAQGFLKSFTKIRQAVYGSLAVSTTAADRKEASMRITAMVVAGLAATALVTAGPASADPQSDAQELRRQISDLDGSWDGLTPQQRNQRIAGLQQQVTQVDLETRNGPKDQLAQVDAILLPSMIHLADLVKKAQTPPTSSCIFPACLPGL